MTALIGALALLTALFAFTGVAARVIEARFPPAGKSVEAGGGTIHVVDRAAGEKERAAVVMIHGAYGNALYQRSRRLTDVGPFPQAD